MIKRKRATIFSRWKAFRRLTSISFKKVQRILGYFKPFWKTWVFLLFSSLLLSGLGLINPLIIKFLIDDVLLKKNLTLLIYLTLFFVVVNWSTNVIRVVTSYYYAKLSQGILYNVRNELFGHLQSLHLVFFHKAKLGDILVRLSEDVTGIEEFASLVFNRAVMNLLTLMAILVVCFFINARLTLITLIIIPFYIYSQSYYAKRLRKIFRELRIKYADLMCFLEERFSSIDLIKNFVQESHELSVEKQKAAKIIDVEIKSTLISSFAGGAINILTFFILLIVLWLGGLEVIYGTMTVGSLIAIYSYLGGLFAPISDLVSLYTDAQSSLVSSDRVFEFLDTKPAIFDSKDAYALPKVTGEIVFDNVNFAYDDNQGRCFTLKDINFKIAPGETIGLFGPSGMGKTTLLNLICRFYEPSRGRISIDDFDIREVLLASLRQQIGLARQNVILFNGSVRDNITYGNPSASIENVVEAAKAADIDDFIQSLPRGYGTHVGVGGEALSAGQRQRIALARIFLKNPNILLLDEATSLLDPTSELVIIEHVMHLFKNKSKIIVTNRIPTLERMDRIFVMHSGQIIEIGTFIELLEKKGVFYKFYRSQRGGFSAFKERLENEINAGIKHRFSLFVMGIKVSNVDYLTDFFGLRETIRILEHVAVSLSSQIPAGCFSIQDPKHRNVFYVVLHGLDRKDVISNYHQFCENLSLKFPKIKLKCGVTEAKPGISIEELLEKSLH